MIAAGLAVKFRFTPDVIGRMTKTQIRAYMDGLTERKETVGVGELMSDLDWLQR